MKLTIDRAVLLSAVSKVAGAASAKSTLPILACVLLTCDGAKLTVSATDTFIGIVHTVPLLGADRGAIAVPAKQFVESVKVMPAGDIDVEVEEDTITLRAKNRRQTIKGQDAAEYPPMPEMPKGHPIPVSSLSRVLNLTHFCISPTDTRPQLTSLLLRMDGILTATATDGHTLARASAALPPGIKGDAFITMRAVQELRRLLDGASGDVTAAIDGGVMYFRVGDTTHWSKLSGATPPPADTYFATAPKPEQCMTLPRVEMLDALRSVAVATDVAGEMRLDLETGTLALSSEKVGSDARDELDVDACGLRGVIGFNAEYFIRVLAASDEETFDFWMGSETDHFWIFTGPKGKPVSSNILAPVKLPDAKNARAVVAEEKAAKKPRVAAKKEAEAGE